MKIKGIAKSLGIVMLIEWDLLRIDVPLQNIVFSFKEMLFPRKQQN